MPSLYVRAARPKAICTTGKATKPLRIRYAEEVNARVLFRFCLPLSGVAVLLTGCTSRVVSGAQAAAQHRAEATTERQELEMIPPPSKTRFMAVRSFESWENPYITVQPDMVTVHVLLADANPTDYGVGGMLRPVGARREELNVSPAKLGEAMSSIPQSAWPYGRVVAVEEAHKTPAKQEPVVRRNMESTVGVLNDLGVVAYDLTDGSVR